MTTCGDCKWWQRGEQDHFDFRLGRCRHPEIQDFIETAGAPLTYEAFGCIFGEAKGGDEANNDTSV
jgi:hypothetical protein